MTLLACLINKVELPKERGVGPPRKLWKNWPQKATCRSQTWLWKIYFKVWVRLGGSRNYDIYHYLVWKGLGLSERVTAHVHIPKSRLQEMFLGCSYTFRREMNLILWMQSTAFFFKCQIIFPSKQERRKWAASPHSCVLLWEARCHQQITQVRSIFHVNTVYFSATGYGIIQYTDQLLGLKILWTLKPIITRKSRYINYSIIWHVAFFHQSLVDAHSNLHC